jgi:leader peptidase (prepilin peptidase)/N-methyltransferase
MRLPDALTLPLIAAGILAKALLAPEQLAESVLGAMSGYLSFRAVAVIYRVLRKRDGLGGGDAKLLSAAGAWVGWAALPDVVLLAAMCGLCFTGIKRATGTAGGQTAIIPFGPCLALALWTIYLFGSFIFDGLR